MTGCVFAASVIFRVLKMAVISLCCHTELFIEFPNTLSECSAGSRVNADSDSTLAYVSCCWKVQ